MKKILKNIFNENNLGIILFWCFICNISPTFGNIFKNCYIDTVFKLISYIVPISLICIYIKFNNIRINKKSFCMLTIFFASQILSNFIFVPNKNYIISSTYNNILNALLLFFVYYVSFSNFRMTKKNVVDFCKRYLWFVFLTCIYNVIYNFNDLLTITSLSNGYSHYFMSFFGNRNTFGLFLISAVIVYFLLKLYETDYKYYYKIFLFFIIINLIITFSRTSIIACIVFLVSYFLLRYKNQFFKVINKKILFFSVFVILLILTTLIFNKNIRDYIINVFIRPTHIFAGRDIIWIFSLNLWLSNNFWFGTGNIYYALELNKYLNSFSCHNIVLTILNRGGIILFSIFSYIFYDIFLKMKKNDILYKWYLSTFFSFLFIGMFESVLPFFSTIYAEMIFCILLITIPISIENLGGE